MGDNPKVNHPYKTLNVTLPIHSWQPLLLCWNDLHEQIGTDEHFNWVYVNLKILKDKVGFQRPKTKERNSVYSIVFIYFVRLHDNFFFVYIRNHLPMKSFFWIIDARFHDIVTSFKWGNKLWRHCQIVAIVIKPY